MGENEVQDGRPQTPAETFWLTKAIELSGESIGNVEAAATQFITTISILHALYAAILSFTDMRQLATDNF